MVKNKIIMITGGNRGIGAVTAKLLAVNGAKVIINYHTDKESSDALIKEIFELTGDKSSVIAFQADVSNETAVKEMVQSVFDKYGKIDVLINNACPQFLPKPFSETDWSEYEKLFQVNLKGAYNLIQSVVPKMKESKGGIIINMLTSYVLGAPPPKISAYITAKYALEGFSKALASELGPFNIRVNMVSPGIVKTKLTEHLPEKMFELISAQTPLRRITTGEDVAQILLFLSSDKAKYLTGVNIPVCGGLVM